MSAKAAIADIIRKAVLVACLFTLNTNVGAQTPEYLTNETTAAESVTELETSLTQIISPERLERAGCWRLPDTGPFLNDSQTKFNFRAYDFERTDGFGATQSQASTLGGELSFESGRWKDTLSVAASWYTSQGVDIDYRPQQGKLEGLWIRLRTANATRMDPTRDRRDVRLIINYDFAML